MKNKIIILSAPSGSGKTTIVKKLLKKISNLEFSISATTRNMRTGEVDGKDYYFIKEDEFRSKISNNEFVEYEEVYKGLYYGTLKTEIDRIWEKGHHAIFDVDVKGGINIKKQFPNDAILIFIKPPSIEELEKRLRNRGTDNEVTIRFRIDRAKEELSYIDQFDVVIVNDVLEKAIEETENTVSDFINMS